MQEKNNTTGFRYKNVRRNGRSRAGFNMIESIMVCLSEVKTATLCWRFLVAAKRANQFFVVAVNLDPKQRASNTFEYVTWAVSTVVEERGIVKKIPEAKPRPCCILVVALSLSHPQRNRATKIALGHHRDVVLFLNMFW